MKIHQRIVIGALLFVLTLPNLSGCSRINEDYSLSETVTSAGSLSAITGNDRRYIYYSSLSPKEQQMYDILQNAAENFQPQAVFPEKLPPETLKKLFLAVYYQENIFWLTSKFYRPDSDSDTLRLTYRYDEEATHQMQADIGKTSWEISSVFDESTSDYEKLKAFHDYIVLNCTFSDDENTDTTLYGALCGGYSMCEGYAAAFNLLCQKSDIPCVTVTGTGSDGASHAWNKVMLDGEWYNVDCTWDDPILNPPDENFIRHYYFLVSDKDIEGITHFPDNTYFSYPECSSDNNYFRREGLYADSADSGIALLSSAAADAISAGLTDAEIRFADEKAYYSAKAALFDRKKIRQVLEYADSRADKPADKTVMTNKYVRYCNDSLLIIHITMICEDTR